MNAFGRQNGERIFGLDLIRSAAILMVLFAHVHYLIGSSDTILISLSGVLGFAGVELFFVLSGYLIGRILLRQYVNDDFSLQSIRVFLKRRWFRTLPNYYLAVFVNLGIGLFWDFPLEGWYRYFLFLQNVKTYCMSFFFESWSLSVEEWTYVLLPFSLLLVLKSKFRFSKKYTFLFTVVLLIVLAHVFRYFNMINSSDITTMEVWNIGLKSIVIYRYDTILFGVLLAWVDCFYGCFLKAYRVCFLIIAVHLFAMQFAILNVLGVDIISSPVYFMVFYFSFSSIIYFLTLPYFIFWENSKPISAIIVSFISRTSYAAYLFHYSVVAVILKHTLYEFSCELPVVWILLIYFGTTFFLSYIVYRFFEKQIMDLRDRI